MRPRPIDFIGAAILTIALIGLVALIVIGSLPVAEA